MNTTEKKILQKIAEQQLMTKDEIAAFLRGNGGELGYEAALKKLMESDLVAAIRPVGSTCYIITQRGARLLSDIE